MLLGSRWAALALLFESSVLHATNTAACVSLIVHPREKISWRTFLKTSPPYSIALDGYVASPTKRQVSGPRANFDHHHGVDRISTRSTSGQVYFEINLGLFRTFAIDGHPHAVIHANDCDEDVCMAVWLLRNPGKVEFNGSPLLNRLVACNDTMDCTAGTFPLTNTPHMEEREWMFAPYRIARQKGRIAKMNGDEMIEVIDQVGEHIEGYLAGKGENQKIGSNYEIFGGGPGWAFVRNAGSEARLAMAKAGIYAYVLDLGNGRFTIGRLSEWVPFPIPKFYVALNAAEPEGLITRENNWGVSETVGGSPYLTGSHLSTKRIEEVINTVLAAEK